MSYDKRERVDILKSMHRLVCAMNDDEAYMAWIICIPDGADDAELEEIALHDEEIWLEATLQFQGCLQPVQPACEGLRLQERLLHQQSQRHQL